MFRLIKKYIYDVKMCSDGYMRVGDTIKVYAFTLFLGVFLFIATAVIASFSSGGNFKTLLESFLQYIGK